MKLLFFFVVFITTTATGSGFLGLGRATASWCIRYIKHGLLDVLRSLQVLAHLLLVKFDELWIFFELDEMHEDIQSCHVMPIGFFVALASLSLLCTLTELGHLLSVR